MAGRFFEWSPDDRPATVVDSTAEGWRALRRRYTPAPEDDPDRRNPAFERIREVVEELEARSIVIERRYIDLDYRSEHSNFYSTTFKRYPSVSHRLHFFSEEVREDLADLGDKREAYIGYSVMRPVPTAPVGRTMIPPPPSLDGAVVCLAKDTVHLWGCPFTVRAMPFASQDQQYMRCSHSAVWMMLYHAHLRHSLPRRVPHDIQQAATGGHVGGRELPSEGLTAGQVLQALHHLGMSAGAIPLPASRDESRGLYTGSLFAIVCRYINSEMPPMIYSDQHAWVIVGYRKSPGAPGHDRITLFRHDDARGPYLEVRSPWGQEGEGSTYVPWRGLVPPLPQKVYMTGETAETIGLLRIRKRAVRLPETNLVRDALEKDGLTVRTYVMRSHEFKEQLAGRVPPELVSLYQLAHMPRWIWVVEAIKRDLLDAGEPAVIGEVVIDATASDVSKPHDPVVILRHLAGEAYMYTPDYEETHRKVVPEFRPYETGNVLLREASSERDSNGGAGQGEAE